MKTRYSLLRWLGIGAASLAGIVAVTVVSLLLFQPTLKLTPFKSSIEIRLTELTGVPVTVRELYLETSLRPRLRVQGLRMARFSVEGSDDLLRAETVEIQIDLIGLLKRRIAVAALLLDRVTIEVDPLLGLLAESSRENFRFAEDEPGPPFFRLEALEDLSLRQVQLNYTHSEGAIRRVRIETLRGGISRTRPLRLEADGHLGDTPLHLKAAGPALEGLLAPGATWPVTAELEVAGVRARVSGTLVTATSSTGAGVSGTLATGTLATGSSATGTPAPGTLARQPSAAHLDLEVTLEGDDLQASLALAGVRTPSLGPFRLQGDLSTAGGSIRFEDIRGESGRTGLRGDLRIDLEGERPSLSGHLSTGRIDLRPWLERPAVDEVAVSEGGGPERSPWDRVLPIDLVEEFLTAFDADVKLTIDGLEGLPTTLEEMSANPRIEDGRLTLPFDLHLAGARVEGRAEVATTEGRLAVALDLSSATLHLDRLFDDLGRGLTTGSLGEVKLSATSDGTTVGELLRRQTLRLESGGGHVRFSKGDTGRQVDVTLSRLEVDRSPDEPLRAILDGDLRGYPYRIEAAVRSRRELADELADRKQVDGKVSVDTLASGEPVAEEPAVGGMALGEPAAGALGPGATWPFKLAAQGLGSRMQIDGTLAIGPEAALRELAFQVSGDRLGDLEPWLGVSAGADHRYRIQGRLIHEADRTELRLDQIIFGRSAARMTAVLPRGAEAPILIDLTASTVFADELKRLAGSREVESNTDDRLTVDIPVWAGDLTLPDMVVNLEVERVARGSTGLADLSAVVADLKVDRGRLTHAGFSLGAEEARLRGGLDIDWEAEPPEMIFDIGGREIDFGRLVDLDGYAEDLEVLAKRFDLEVLATGQTLGQMLGEGSSVSGSAEELSLSVRFLDRKEPFVIALSRAEISESRAEPIMVKADGLIGEWPLDLELRLHSEDLTGSEGEPLPVELSLRAGEIRVDTSGRFKLPLTSRNLDLSFSVEAEKVSSFEPFFERKLSTSGPFRAAGDLSLRPDTYSFSELSVTVGESDIGGELTILRTGTRPRLIADLSSRRIDVAELFADPSPSAEIGEGPEGGVDSSDANQEQEADGSGERIESNPWGKVDVDLDLQIDEIQWGGASGGGGEIRARLEEGRFVIDPFDLALAEGRVVGQVGLIKRDGLIEADVDLTVEDVPYGPLLDIFDPEAAETGTIDLQTRLKSVSTSDGRLLPHATGELRFAAYPHDIDTAILDFWAAGLVDSMVSLLDPTRESTLNCIVGDVSLADGQMTIDTFWLDSSRVRARGRGSIDLDERTIDLTLRPRPKKRTFLSLATPAEIKGPLRDPSISLTSGGIAGTAFRIYMWFVTIYGQILKKPLPTDGSDICFLPPPAEEAERPPGEPVSAVGDPPAGRAGETTGSH